jgi:hypothetical protein
MCQRKILPWLILGTLLAGAALATPSAPGDPPGSSGLSRIDTAAAKKITLAGVVELDETKLVRVAAKVKGRIDKLHVQVTGQQVKAGQPLADLSSPDLTATTQNLLDADRGGNSALARVAQERLRLWGIDDAQVYRIPLSGKPVSRLTVRSPAGGRIIKKYPAEGEYVEEGARLFDVADLATVWVEAAIKDDADVTAFQERLPVSISTKAVPGRDYGGEVLSLFRDEKARTLKVRITVRNPSGELLPGMLATVTRGVSATPPAGPPDGKDAKLKELLQERLAILRKLVQVTTTDYQAGKASFERVHQASRALLQARLDVCESDKERIALLEEAVGLARNYEKNAVQRYKAGVAPQSDVLTATAARLESEIALERAKAKAGAARPK